MANKGDGVFVIKIKVPTETDKEKIHSDFIQKYETELKLLEEKYKERLEAKENEISIYRQQSADLLEITKILANKPVNINTEVNPTMAQSQSGDKVTGNQQNNQFNAPVGIGGVQGNVNVEDHATVGGVVNQNNDPDLTKISQKITELVNYFEQNQNAPYPEVIQQIKLVQESCPDITNSERVKSAIQNNPTLENRLLAASSAALIETIKVLLPPVGVAIEAIKAYRNPG